MSALKSLFAGLLLLGPLALGTRADSISSWNSWTTESAPSSSLNQPGYGTLMGQSIAYDFGTAKIVTTNPASWPDADRVADARVNMSVGPYPASASLTSSPPKPWYDSPAALKVFGRIPDAIDRQFFPEVVLNRVAYTFGLSGIPITLTQDPTIAAAHTLSVVGDTSYGPSPGVIGMTYVGGDGLSYFDRFSGAKSINELGWIVAHNIAHELIHAFGVGHHDTTGDYLDSAVTSWETMTDPEARFSDAAIADLLSRDLSKRTVPLSFNGQSFLDEPGGCSRCGDASFHHHSEGMAMIQAAPVPEPATIALWLAASTGLVLSGQSRRRRRRDSAA